MALCSFCDGDVSVVDGCDAAFMHAYRYGTEPWFESGEYEPLDRCADCGARISHHHHADCLYAHCSLCNDQALICDHNIGDEP